VVDAPGIFLVVHLIPALRTGLPILRPHRAFHPAFNTI